MGIYQSIARIAAANRHLEQRGEVEQLPGIFSIAQHQFLSDSFSVDQLQSLEWLNSPPVFQLALFRRLSSS